MFRKFDFKCYFYLRYYFIKIKNYFLKKIFIHLFNLCLYYLRLLKYDHHFFNFKIMSNYFVYFK